MHKAAITQHILLYLAYLQFSTLVLAAPPIDHGVMTKGDVAMAAVDGLGSLVNTFGQRLMEDLDDFEQILMEQPTPPPVYNFQEQPIGPFEEPDVGAPYPIHGIVDPVNADLRN